MAVSDAPDLTPRPTAERSRRSGRRILPIVVLTLVMIAGGVIITQALSTAVDYYCNVDEIGVRSGCDEDRRLRLQGTVAEGSVVTGTVATIFDIEFNDVVVAVEYEGEPGGIFRECLPVVVHGVFDTESGLFLGDRVEVKHSEEYVAVNDDRLSEAEAMACQPSA
ncbi:MAG: cytochrome c maturation protein CcmE [Actinomycetota bacterium]|jgi:cytochrome c-type biogenesis protein CcmE|nr:cytochrome c maturation protein CcmE [Actinomycetota bacterium]MDA3015688.1 cytochrome c maturation protein CcmE [Actinomycetota bacterium]MDA3027556.1 cytochrome c maturation protein CcmE [Actinomycetota bacterium]